MIKKTGLGSDGIQQEEHDYKLKYIKEQLYSGKVTKKRDVIDYRSIE